MRRSCLVSFSYPFTATLNIDWKLDRDAVVDVDDWAIGRVKWMSSLGVRGTQKDCQGRVVRLTYSK